MDNDPPPIVLFLVALVFGFIAGFLLCGARDATNIRQQAIDAGVGYWAVDEKTGVTEFKWRACDGDETQAVQQHVH